MNGSSWPACQVAVAQCVSRFVVLIAALSPVSLRRKSSAEQDPYPTPSSVQKAYRRPIRHPRPRPCAPVADPHYVGFINIDRVRLRPVTRQMPVRPGLRLAVAAKEIARLPAGDPKTTPTVAPDPSRILSRYRRVQNRSHARSEIDLTEIVAGKRS